MRDPIIRQAFHQSVLRPAHVDADTFVVDELGLRNGSVRADIAVLNGKLIGYEIKTETDTLSRLAAQVTAYSEVFDKAYIIVSENHLKKCLDQLPKWWGVYIIGCGGDNDVTFELYREGRPNKNKNCYSLAQLLWKDEALELANTYLRHNIRPNTCKHEVYDVISGTCSSDKLSKMVIQYLKQRINWRKDHRQLL
jgi:hypothetical protein